VRRISLGRVGSASGALDPAVRTTALVVVVGTLMSILDTTIVNVAIDTLAREFHSPLSTVQWVVTGYMLALATVIPLTGWAAERFGTRRLWLASLGMFMAGSALCGLAWSAESLIAFRILQGLGGGMILPVAMTILAQSAGPQQMGRVMAYIGIPALLGPVFGPVLGGFLVDDASWRWIFFVNIPIGVLAIWLAVRKLPPDGPPRPARLDVRGFLLCSPGLAALVYGLSEVATQGSLSDVPATVALVAGVALLVAFAWHATRVDDPLIDVRLFREPRFTAGATATFMLGAAVFGVMILLPLYYQVVRGESALTAGLLLAPQGIGAAAAMPIAGRLTDRIGPGRVVIGGVVLALVGTAAYTQVGPDTSYALLAGSLIVRGLGIGGTFMPAFAAAYQPLRRDQVPKATSALNIVQRVGGSVGTALLAVLLQERIHAGVPGVSGIGAAGGAGGSAPTAIAAPLAHAFSETFWAAMAVTALALVPAVWLLRSGRTAPAPPPDEVARTPVGASVD
jgi:EmrB/QacA subfamily drug resistance transporter